MANQVELHQDLFNSKLKRLADRVLPRPAPPRLQLRIETGLHSDVDAEIRKSAFVIGSAPECDLVLLDDCIAEKHATVRVQNSVFGQAIQVATKRDDVLLDGVAITKSTPSSFTTVPAVLRVGEVDIKFSGPDGERRGRLLALNDRLIRVCVVILTFFLVLLGMDLAADPAQSPMLSEAQMSDSISEAEAKPDPHQLLTQRIEEAGLSQSLALTKTSDTTFHVSGRLTVGEMADWQKIHRWFDQNTDGTLLTTKVEPTPVLTGFPAVASVRLGGHKEVRFLSGKTASIGDQVHGNWVIDDITVEGIRVRNDKETLQIAF